MQINQLQEEGAEQIIDLNPAIYDYYTRHLKDETFVTTK